METERNLLTTTEAARYLGLKPSYLYKLMMRRAIPYYNIRVRSQAEIDSDAVRYLANRRADK